MSYGAQSGRGWRGAQLPGLWRDWFGSKSEAKATRCPGALGSEIGARESRETVYSFPSSSGAWERL